MNGYLRGVPYSKIPGERVLSTCATLEAKYRVPFHFASDRAGAALWTIKLLEAAWRRAQAHKAQPAKTSLEMELLK